jgi:mono/diheme cytochrome c family protein
MRIRVALLSGAVVALAGTAQAQTQTPPPAYKANCQVCHQADAGGLPGQFPRLKGRVGDLATTPDGRKYLAKVVVHGLSGKISVDGKTILGVMPAYGSLSDADLSATLTYLASLPSNAKKKPAPFTAAEIKAIRTPRMTGSDLKAERERLATGNLMP